MKSEWMTITGVALMLSTAPTWAQSERISQGASEQRSKTIQSGGQQTVRHVQCSKLLGSEVKSAQGESLGKVEDIVINTQTGDISMAILGTSFAGGRGEVITPVPWKALNVESEKSYVLNIDKQKLSTAPSMQKGQYSQLQDPNYVVHVFTFYGVENPEAAGGTGQGSSGQQQGGKSSR